MVPFLRWLANGDSGCPAPTQMDNLIVYANKMESVEASKPTVNELSEGHGLPGYQSKGLSVGETGPCIDAHKHKDFFSVVFVAGRQSKLLHTGRESIKSKHNPAHFELAGCVIPAFGMQYLYPSPLLSIVSPKTTFTCPCFSLHSVEREREREAQAWPTPPWLQCRDRGA